MWPRLLGERNWWAGRGWHAAARVSGCDRSNDPSVKSARVQEIYFSTNVKEETGDERGA